MPEWEQRWQLGAHGNKLIQRCMFQYIYKEKNIFKEIHHHTPTHLGYIRFRFQCETLFCFDKSVFFRLSPSWKIFAHWLEMRNANSANAPGSDMGKTFETSARLLTRQGGCLHQPWCWLNNADNNSRDPSLLIHFVLFFSRRGHRQHNLHVVHLIFINPTSPHALSVKMEKGTLQITTQFHLM